MRIVLLCGLIVVLAGGCKKPLDKLQEQTQVKPNEKFTTTQNWLTDQKGGGDQPAVHAPTGTVINSGGGGGSGGAAQAVRKAAVRTVNMNEFENIRLFIENAAAFGQMPSKEEVERTLMKEAPKTYKLVQDKVIIITGAKTREGIWAYTYDAQDAMDQHLVIRAGNIERMPRQTLIQAMGNQGR